MPTDLQPRPPPKPPVSNTDRIWLIAMFAALAFLGWSYLGQRAIDPLPGGAAVETPPPAQAPAP